MKTLYLLFAIASPAISQTLAPVESGGFSLWPLVIIAGIGGVAFAFHVWHKRNPSKADAQVASALVTAKDDASALAAKVAEAMTTLTRTNREQAMVIASPPVQAAINAGPPIQAAPPAPQNAPQATIPTGPLPSPVPAPVPAPAAPIAAAPVPTGPPNTFGLTQKDIQAGAAGGYSSAKYQANLAAVGGDQAALNVLQNWFQEGGGGYRADQDERFLTDPHADMRAYGLHWNGARWIP